jgi:hypothetical protein
MATIPLRRFGRPPTRPARQKAFAQIRAQAYELRASGLWRGRPGSHPGSRKGPLVEIGSNGELTIYVREPAVDGKANDAVARLLAAHLQLPRSRVELVSGATSRQKRFRVSR